MQDIYNIEIYFLATSLEVFFLEVFDDVMSGMRWTLSYAGWRIAGACLDACPIQVILA